MPNAEFFFTVVINPRNAKKKKKKNFRTIRMLYLVNIRQAIMLSMRELNDTSDIT